VETAVVVLAGGDSRRWSGRDKTAVLLAGVPVLEHAVRGLAAAADVDLGDVVVVAPAEHPVRPRLALDRSLMSTEPGRGPVTEPARGVRWVREEPPGGGPVAGLAAGIAVLPPAVTLVVVAAGDAPFAGEAVSLLLEALDEGLDGAIGVDPDGRDQPLLAVYRAAPLRAALPPSPAETSLRELVGRLRLARVPVGPRAALDLDTPEDLATAEGLLSS
jgi:molybdopterin-guanine dinucleotide biosynthesis protein A